MKTNHSNLWHVLFRIGIVTKAIDGFLETAGGIVFLCVSHETIMHTIFSITQHRLWEDPDDWIATHLRHGFQHLSTGNKIFAVIYLLAHGLIKLGLAACLWRSKLWAFPVSMIALTAFVGYQAFRLVNHFSVILCVLMTLDIIVTALIWREYRRLKQQKK